MFERPERATEGGGAGQRTVGDRELGFEVEAMLNDPLPNGASGALTTDEGSSNEREQERPGMPFAASLARVRKIGDGVHQSAIVGLVHHAPSLVGRVPMIVSLMDELIHLDFGIALGDPAGPCQSPKCRWIVRS